MNDDDLRTAVHSTVRYDPSRGERVLRSVGPDLLEQIMRTPESITDSPSTLAAGPGLELAPLAPAPPHDPRRRRMLTTGAVAAAVALAIAIPSYAFHGGHGPASPKPVAPAAQPGHPLGLKSSRTGTRVLVDETGWKIGVVEQTPPNGWELHVSRGPAELTISAFNASQKAEMDAGRQVTKSTPRVPVLGAKAALVQRDAHSWEVVTDVRRGQFLDIWGNLDRKPFVEELTKLRWVDQKSYEASMPAGVVTSHENLAVAQQMLRGVPLPPGVSVRDMDLGLTEDRYQFGAAVTGKVVCRWIQLDLAARTARDQAGQQDADAALASSRNWPILNAMRSQGEWPQEVWEYADSITKGTPVPAGSDRVTVANSYKAAFGCT